MTEKRILVVCDQPTHPIIGGNRMCMMQYVKVLRDLGASVYFLYVDNHNAGIDDLNATQQYWGDSFFYYDMNSIQYSLLRIMARCKCADNVDMLFPWGLNRYVNALHSKLHFSGLIFNYIWLSKLTFCNIPVKAIFTHDVFSYRNERVKGAEWLSFPVSQEAKAIRRCENILSIQDIESSYYSILSPSSNVVTVYSSFEYVEQPIVDNKAILFFSGAGSLNVNAINDFIKNVFPLLLQKDSDIKLYIGGKICDCLDVSKLSENIELKGLYDNPSDFYQLGNIVINPVSEGSGLKIKTFESIAHGKVTVVDKHSATGIYSPESAPLYITRNAEEYCEWILTFLSDKTKIEAVKQQCKQYITSLNEYISGQYQKMFLKEE